LYGLSLKEALAKLISMQERAKLLDGTMTIRSSPGKGTLIIVSTPITGEVSEA
jgi:signal transduction histidine kinase